MINLAFIGAGSIAGTHAKAANPDVIKIVAAVDVNAASAEALVAPHGGRAFRSLDDLFRAMDGGLRVDAVALCTPPSVRREVLARVAERRLHALVEKPLAATADEAGMIASIAHDHPGLVFAVGFCHRFTPAIEQMRALLGKGKIGHLVRFENTFAFHYPPMREKWFSDPAISGGGALLDAGCHSVDLFHFLVGPSKSVGTVLDKPWPGRGECGGTALLRCAQGPHAGAAGVIVSGWMEGERFEVRLIGDAGTLTYDYMKPEELVFAPVTGNPEVIKVESHEVRFARQLTHFAKACASATDPAVRPPMAGVAEGLAAARTLGGALSNT